MELGEQLEGPFSPAVTPGHPYASLDHEPSLSSDVALSKENCALAVADDSGACADEIPLACFERDGFRKEIQDPFDGLGVRYPDVVRFSGTLHRGVSWRHDPLGFLYCDEAALAD
ncbi:MAG: hypothetical protein H6686_13040 [Fibrobacteria bacterium]|nr:hypothetical protein [Fibrobacteria bacterium]